MKASKDFFDFNKEILFGEVGSLVGIQLASFLAIHFPRYQSWTPHFIVFGAMIIGSLFWILARVYYKSREEKYSEKKFFNDVKYFTPASVLFSLFFYYPTLFFAVKYFLEHNKPVEFSAILSQGIAFLIFLVSINIYRYLLFKVFNKKL
jgi:hypothetical protein